MYSPKCILNVLSLSLVEQDLELSNNNKKSILALLYMENALYDDLYRERAF